MKKRERNKIIKKMNKNNFFNELNKRKIKYKILNNDNWHSRTDNFDFWPTTLKFCSHDYKIKGKGIKNFIKEYEKFKYLPKKYYKKNYRVKISVGN